MSIEAKALKESGEVLLALTDGKYGEVTAMRIIATYHAAKVMGDASTRKDEGAQTGCEIASPATTPDLSAVREALGIARIFAIANCHKAKAAEVIHAIDSARVSLLTTPQPSPDGWQDISTAPRDGTSIILCNPDFEPENMTVALWNGEAWEYADNSYYHCPTHWMPLPKPPAALQPAKEK